MAIDLPRPGGWGGIAPRPRQVAGAGVTGTPRAIAPGSTGPARKPLLGTWTLSLPQGLGNFTIPANSSMMLGTALSDKVNGPGILRSISFVLPYSSAGGAAFHVHIDGRSLSATRGYVVDTNVYKVGKQGDLQLNLPFESSLEVMLENPTAADIVGGSGVAVGDFT